MDEWQIEVLEFLTDLRAKLYEVTKEFPVTVERLEAIERTITQIESLIKDHQEPEYRCDRCEDSGVLVCYMCGGEGVVGDDERQCPRCGGDGEVECMSEVHDQPEDPYYDDEPPNIDYEGIGFDPYAGQEIDDDPVDPYEADDWF